MTRPFQASLSLALRNWLIGTKAKDGAFDIAILDVTIRGGKVYPVAEELIARNIPFILASGYGDWALPPPLREKRRLTKPFTAAKLEEQVRLLFSEAAT